MNKRTNSRDARELIPYPFDEHSDLDILIWSSFGPEQQSAYLDLCVITRFAIVGRQIKTEEWGCCVDNEWPESVGGAFSAGKMA